MAISWSNTLNRSIHKFIIKRKTKDKEQVREFTGLDKANTIGILYMANKKENVEKLVSFSDKIAKKNKNVHLLGLLPNKKLESLKEEFPEQRFISQNELSWYRVPKKLSSSRFIKNEFDILINMYLKESLPLQYISSLSKAKFRIGHYRKKNLYCNDFLIDLNGAKELDKLIELVEYFISKNKNNEQE
tara:strand:+ start:33 stop:596 length:564 start_codon:yes stop_codon:yes gene_type:complete